MSIDVQEGRVKMFEAFEEQEQDFNAFFKLDGKTYRAYLYMNRSGKFREGFVKEVKEVEKVDEEDL